MSGRKLTDAYWMEVGALRERERIIEGVVALTRDHPDAELVLSDGTTLSEYWNKVVALIKNEPHKELQRLAEETGEYKNFDNSLIDDDYNRLDNPIIGGVQKLNDILGIIGK